MEYSTGFMPISVALEDFNNDNQLDIVVANFWDKTVSILIGYGNGSFRDQRTYIVGVGPQSVAVGDFNSDNRMDIVVSNNIENTVNVLLGHGNGSFDDRRTYRAGYELQSVVIGDFNNDTRLDMVVANSYSNTVSVLLRYDRGALANETTFSSGDGSRLQSVVVFDLNNDSFLDIVVANDGTNNIGVLLGNGNGTFRDQLKFSTGVHSHPHSIALGDFNVDDQMDIAVANRVTKNIILFLGDGNGMFESQDSNDNVYDATPLFIGAGDLNNDETSEIIVTYYGIDNVDVFAVYDTGYFPKQTTYLTGSWPQSTAIDCGAQPVENVS
ncbi:unnamed protein product [Rotaria sp. Silwood1]|nr:unnamed protein product [Rotaria sp. Silwood1]